MIKLIIGNKYKVKWQSQPGMQFTLLSINGDTCLLGTKKKNFTTKISDLKTI